MPFALIYHNLARHWLRTVLTLASLVVAMFLTCFLSALVLSLEAGVRGAASNRLVTQSAVSLFVNLPLSYQSKLEQVEGVEAVSKWQWFGGYYQDPRNFFAQFGVDQDTYFDTYPEVRLLEGSRADFEAKRTSCIIGKDLAEQFEWRVGDTIPLIGGLFPRADGGVWEFEVAAIYEARLPVDNRTLFFHFDYLEKSLEEGAAEGPGGVGVYVLRIAEGANELAIMRTIDALYENGPQRVQTTTEAEFNRQFVSMIGNVPKLMGSIGGGVLFAIVLAALNTMLMAARERTRDLGIMKALGFTNATAFALLLFESLLVCALGGSLGVALALATEDGFAYFLTANLFPGYDVTPALAWTGIGLSAAIGLVAGVIPAWQASRLEPVAALRSEG